jgi:hypothetical protein
MSDSTHAGTVPAGAAPPLVRAYVNEHPVSVPRGATAFEVIRAFSPEAAAAVAGGTQRITDSRGLPLDPTTPAHGGAIYRLLPARTVPAREDA